MAAAEAHDITVTTGPEVVQIEMRLGERTWTFQTTRDNAARRSKALEAAIDNAEKTGEAEVVHLWGELFVNVRPKGIVFGIDEGGKVYEFVPARSLKEARKIAKDLQMPAP